MAFKMKNMQYWKYKNNIPGINNDFEKGNNLPDGRSKSSPFQINDERDAKWEAEGQTIIGRTESGEITQEEGNKLLANLQAKIKKIEASETSDKKTKKSTESAHGQLNDAQVEYEEDVRNK